MPNSHKKSWMVSNSYYWILEIVMSVSVHYSTSWRSSPCKTQERGEVYRSIVKNVSPKTGTNTFYFWIDKDLCLPHLRSLFHPMDTNIALLTKSDIKNQNITGPLDGEQNNRKIFDRFIWGVHKIGCQNRQFLHSKLHFFFSAVKVIPYF